MAAAQVAGADLPGGRAWARKQGFTVPVDAWIAPRAEEIAERLPAVAALRALRPQAAAEFRAGGDGVRWPLLFFAVWSLIHLEGASRSEALQAVAGRHLGGDMKAWILAAAAAPFRWRRRPQAQMPLPPAAIYTDPPADQGAPGPLRGAATSPRAAWRSTAMAYIPAGAGPHPTVVLLHGLPGNEKNLDLAQAMRRAAGRW